jgi:hypothetical protein
MGNTPNKDSYYKDKYPDWDKLDEETKQKIRSLQETGEIVHTAIFAVMLIVIYKIIS